VRTGARWATAMKPLGNAKLAEVEPRGALLDCGPGVQCRINVLQPDLVRVLFLRDGKPRQPRTWMVPARGADDVPWQGRDRLDDSSWPQLQASIDTTDDAVRIATGALNLTAHLSPLHLEWSLPDGRNFARDRPKHPVMFGEGDTQLRHYFARHPGDRYYGLGDKNGPLDLHGRRLRIAMSDSLGFDPKSGDPMYKHWPFLIARDGETGVSCGVLYDNMAAATFDLGAEHDNYYDLYRGYEAADGDLDYYFLLGPRLADVTPKFLRLTGKMALPPRWTLGYAQTAMAIADAPDAQARMEDFIARCKSEEIPISAFHFGSGYSMIGPRRYVFHWNRAKFPDAPGLMRRFHDAGIRIVANLKPCLLNDHPQFEAAKAAGAFVRERGTDQPVISRFWDGEGAHVDFTSPAGIAWWQNGLQREILETGMDVAWNDNNEYGPPTALGECDGFGDAIALDLARPLQPLLMTRASLERQRTHAPAERQFSVTRAGCPGIQRYAQTWSGDNSTSWASLKWNLRLGLQMSLSGMYNIGHDIGGFSGPVPDAELLIRWTQALLLHPRFIMNSWKPHGVYTTPWLHPAATPAIRAAIRLRYRLIPYLYSLMHEAAAQDSPVLRPTFVQFEDDPSCFDECDELMCGPFLLAAPVVAPGERARRAYLPAGPDCWFDFYTEERLPAGQEATLAAPLDRLPLIVPEGAIVPMTDAATDFSHLHDEPSRRIRLFPGEGSGASRFVLTEDDGISASGARTRITLDLSWTPEQIALDAQADGIYPVPARQIALVLPAAERRPLVVSTADGAGFHLSRTAGEVAAR